MVSFIHIADKNDEQAILRNGIRPMNRRAGVRVSMRPLVFSNFLHDSSVVQRAEEAGNQDVDFCSV